MAESSSGSGFMGVMIGALVVIVAVLAFFVFTGRLGGNHDAVDVNIHAPKIEAPKMPAPG